MRTAMIFAGSWVVLSIGVALAFGRIAGRNHDAPGLLRPDVLAPSTEPHSVPRAATSDAMWETTDADVIALALHGLRDIAGDIAGSGDTLRTGWAAMDDSQRDQMLLQVVTYGEHLGAVIDDLLLGMPEPLQKALDALALGRDLRVDDAALAHSKVTTPRTHP